MRKLAAALGAIVLMATVAAGPVAAAKPVPTFDTSGVCIDSSGHYSISLSWDNVRPAYVLFGKSNEVTETTTPTVVEQWLINNKATNIGGWVDPSKFTGSQYVAVTLVNRKMSPLFPWTYYAIDSLASC